MCAEWLLMVMRNEKGYSSVNCKPTPSDSLHMPLTQFQCPTLKSQVATLAMLRVEQPLLKHGANRSHSCPGSDCFKDSVLFHKHLLSTYCDQSRGLKDYNISKLQCLPTGNRTCVGVSTHQTECDFPLPHCSCLGFMGRGAGKGAWHLMHTRQAIYPAQSHQSIGTVGG